VNGGRWVTGGFAPIVGADEADRAPRGMPSALETYGVILGSLAVVAAGAAYFVHREDRRSTERMYRENPRLHDYWIRRRSVT